MPARSIIRANPAVVKGEPRSELNTKGDFGSWSRCSRRRARSSSPSIGWAPSGGPKNRDLRTREHLTEVEVERLLVASRGNRHGHRDGTMMLVACRHGLWARELVDLTLGPNRLPNRFPARLQGQTGHSPHCCQRCPLAYCFRKRGRRTVQGVHSLYSPVIVAAVYVTSPLIKPLRTASRDAGNSSDCEGCNFCL